MINNLQACSEGFNSDFQKERFFYLWQIKNYQHYKLSIFPYYVVFLERPKIVLARHKQNLTHILPFSLRAVYWTVICQLANSICLLANSSYCAESKPSLSRCCNTCHLKKADAAASIQDIWNLFLKFGVFYSSQRDVHKICDLLLWNHECRNWGGGGVRNGQNPRYKH